MTDDRSASVLRLPGDLPRTLERLVRNPRFEQAILGVIVLNAITLGLDTSATVAARFGGLLAIVDTVILAIFVIELVLRMIALGGRFWRDPWCLFDFVVVAITLVPATGNLSIFRALRILRAMRLISAVSSVRRVVGSLLSAIPSMGAVIFLLLLINYIFAVMSTNMFGGAFPELFGTIGASFYTLFQIMTLEGWSGEIVRPVMAKFPWAWAVFVPYIVVVTFAVLNLFIGIIVDAMQHQTDEASERVIEVSETEYMQLMREIRALRSEVQGLKQHDVERD
jgi:voltage-gated sodium channel